MASGSGTLPKPSLDQYVFSDKLGSGTYASVYKAYRKSGLREVVAIKCVLKSSLNKASTDNLLTEIEILKKLKHEYIVLLKDFSWDANYIYLIMEYCGGGDLSRFVRSKRALPEHIVKRFLQQIASAMKFLWDNNIAHMDLKPQNILLTSSSSPQIKLADFGFAKPLYDGDCLHVMRGSPLYMAPEIICQKQYDNRVDLWSIGVILYECMFGKAPFASKSYRELGEKIWDDKPVEIPSGFNISESIRDLLLRLLKREPSQRIKFEEFFAHPFVDMEHLPSQHSLPNAIKIVTNAVTEDRGGNYKSAVQLYCEALSFFIPAIHYEKSQTKKTAIRAKVKEYMDRAETLKKMMKPNSSFNNYDHNVTSEGCLSESTEYDSDCLENRESVNPHKTSSSSLPLCSFNASVKSSPDKNLAEKQFDELYSLCADSPKLTAALKVINGALEEEQTENYKECLRHFELGIGTLLQLVPGEPKGKRKDVLNSQILQWMKKAETIKSYLEVQHLDTDKHSYVLGEDSEISQSKQCILQ